MTKNETKRLSVLRVCIIYHNIYEEKWSGWRVWRVKRENGKGKSMATEVGMGEGIKKEGEKKLRPF